MHKETNGKKKEKEKDERRIHKKLMQDDNKENGPQT